MSNILVTGRGTSGSFAIRGDQLGSAIGATVRPQAGAKDMAGHRMAVLVKRPTAGILQAVQSVGMPLIWDVVDSWHQPEGNDWSRDACMAWARMEMRRIKPMAVVCATRAMAEDFHEFGVPLMTLPHHAMPWSRPIEIRDRVGIVAYQGGEHYLGRWEPMLRTECQRRGWRLEINPPSLAGSDIVVALRDTEGHAARNWKSNVKLANAQGWGLPCVLNREAGYRETASGAECWADTAAELAQAFDLLADPTERRARSTRMAVAAPRLEPIAEDYAEWLRSL